MDETPKDREKLQRLVRDLIVGVASGIIAGLVLKLFGL